MNGVDRLAELNRQFVSRNNNAVPTSSLNPNLPNTAPFSNIPERVSPTNNTPKPTRDELGIPNPHASLAKKSSIIPKLLWGFSPQYESCRMESVRRVMMEIEEVSSRYDNYSTKLKRDQRAGIANLRESRDSDIEYQQNKKAEILNRARDTEQEFFNRKDSEIIRELNQIENEKNSVVATYEEKIKNSMDICKLLITDIDNLIEAVNIDPNTIQFEKDVSIYQNLLNELITITDVAEVYAEMRNSLIQDILETGDQTLIGKVSHYSDNSLTTLAASSLVLTSFIPIVTLAASMKFTKKLYSTFTLKNKMDNTLSKVKSLKYQLLKYYTYLKDLPAFDTSIYDRRMSNKLQEIEESYYYEQQSLSEELQSLRARANSLTEDDIIRSFEDQEKILNERMEAEFEKLRNEYTNKYESLKEKLKEEKEEFISNNTTNEIRNTQVEDCFENIKDKKSKLLDYLMYEDYTSMVLSENNINSDAPEEVARARYDEDIENIYIPRYEYVKDIHETYDEFNQDYLDALKEEDQLYYLDYGKLNFGTIIPNLATVPKDLNEIYKGTDLGENSILFVYDSEQEEAVLLNYVQSLIQQICSTMHPSSVEIAIINENMSTQMKEVAIDTSFIKDGKKIQNGNYVTVMSLSQIEEYRRLCQRTFLNRQTNELAGGYSLKDRIAEKRKNGSMTPKYYITVITSGEDTSEFDVYSNSSADTGMINFRFIKRRVLLKENRNPSSPSEKYTIDDKLKDKFQKIPIIIDVAQVFPDGVALLGIYNKNTKGFAKLLYTPKPRQKIIEDTAYLKDRHINMASAKPMFTVSEFILQLTGGKYYTETTEKFIKMYPGREDGDVSKMNPIIIDETAYPHVYIAGTTGGGKSVHLSAIVNVWKVLYSNKELSIMYYDFKKVEAMLHARPYSWANCSMISGSETGEYIISVMGEIVREMTERYETFGKVGANKYSDFRKILQKRIDRAKDEDDLELVAELEKYWLPRMVIIIDELKAGFTLGDAVADAIKKSLHDILAKARAAGMHLLCLSQSDPSDIPEADFNLFAIRGCTKATKDISQAVIGNDFCARQENQYLGFVGYNDNISREEQYNRAYLTPFSQDEDTWKYSKITYDITKERFPNMLKEPVIYSDDDPVYYDDLERYERENGTSTREINLGNKVKYMPKYKPATLDIAIESNSNIAFISAQRERKLNFLRLQARFANIHQIPCVTFFSKAVPESFDVDNLYNRFLLQETVYKDKNNKVVKPNIITEDAYNELSKDPSFNKETTHTRKMWDAMLENGELKKEIRDVKYYDASFYGKATRKSDSETMVGLIKSTLTMLINAKKNKYSNTPKSDMPLHFINIYDPELDGYIVESRSFNSDQEFKLLLSEAPEYGIIVTTLTSQGYKFGSQDYYRYMIGAQPGQQNDDIREFKRLESTLGIVVDKVLVENTFKVKFAVERGSEDNSLLKLLKG